jgi:hypothetical protein
MTVNPYAAPGADGDAPAASGAPGSLEGALAGNYDFEIEEVLREAWRLTSGFKLTFWIACIIAAVVVGIATGIVGAVLGRGMLSRGLMQVLSQGLFYVAFLGVTMLAVRRAAGLPIKLENAFGYLNLWLPTLLAGFLVSILEGIGFMLLIIPGIYLAVGYYFTMPLLGDRKMGSWDAMEASRKAVTHKWLKVFLTGLVTILLVGLSGVLVVPLFWTIPWAAMVGAVVYRRIFGVASTA